MDAHFQDGTGSVSVILLTWKAANSSIMNGGNQSPLNLHKMHSQKWLTLQWRSFSEWGSDRVIYSFAKECSKYDSYG